MPRISFIFLILFVACEKDSHVPEELISAFKYLDNNMSSTDLSKLQSKDDKGFPPFYHKLDIQDEIQTKLSENDPTWQLINTYFDSLGINTNTDKYGLVINSYQDYLNEIDIDIREEIDLVTSYWSPILSCDSIQLKRAKHYVNQIETNDTITIQMPVDEHENAVDYFCPNIDWTFIKEHDLELQVVIREKVITDKNDINFFKAEVIFMSDDAITVLSQEIKKGDFIKIPTKTAWKLN